MEFRILEPLEVLDGDRALVVFGQRQRSLLGLRLAGPAVEGSRDASRLLANASLAVQRALSVAAEPLLIEPGPEGLVAAAVDAGVTVVGLSDRWRKDGLGPSRAALAGSGRPTLIVRKGLRPGGLAPAENLTRFTWSLKAG